MPRQFWINGECMVKVKTGVAVPLAAASGLVELGLSDNPIRVTLQPKYLDIQVNAFGGQVPPERQQMLAEAMINMTLVNIDRTVLRACEMLSMNMPVTYGTLGVAGTLMGGGAARFGTGWRYVGLNLTAPNQSGSLPYAFQACTLEGSYEIPLGTERSIFNLTWRAIPYASDPNGSSGTILWSTTLDT